MFGEVVVIAFILYLMGDTVSRGKLTAVMKGTTKGVARETGRATKAGVKRAHADKIAYLESGKAPLGRTRLRAGKVARGGTSAVTRGALDGVRDELTKLRAAIDAARDEAERERAAQQDPAQGIKRGKLGHSFDVAPAPVQSSGSGAKPAAGTPKSPPSEQRPAEQSSTPYGPDAPAPEPTPEGITDMSTMTTATAGSGGAHVEVRSLPGFIAACDSIAALIVSVSEQATGFGLQPQAQAGLVDAGDIMRAVAQSARDTYSALIEAADGTPQGAEGVTVGAARNE